MNTPAFEEDKMMARLHHANLRSECLANWELAKAALCHDGQPTTHVASPAYSAHARQVLATLRARRRPLARLLRWLGRA